jgi:hypothetical protein
VTGEAGDLIEQRPGDIARAGGPQHHEPGPTRLGLAVALHWRDRLLPRERRAGYPDEAGHNGELELRFVILGLQSLTLVMS